jgi:hypothetical protein
VNVLHRWPSWNLDAHPLLPWTWPPVRRVCLGCGGELGGPRQSNRGYCSQCAGRARRGKRGHRFRLERVRGHPEIVAFTAVCEALGELDRTLERAIPLSRKNPQALKALKAVLEPVFVAAHRIVLIAADTAKQANLVHGSRDEARDGLSRLAERIAKREEDPYEEDEDDELPAFLAGSHPAA